jgi:hypothetical protein
MRYQTAIVDSDDLLIQPSRQCTPTMSTETHSPLSACPAISTIPRKAAIVAQCLPIRHVLGTLHAHQFPISDRVWCLARSLNPGVLSFPLTSLMLGAHQCGTLPRAKTPLSLPLLELSTPHLLAPSSASFVLSIPGIRIAVPPVRDRPAPAEWRAGKQVQSVLVPCSQCSAILSAQIDVRAYLQECSKDMAPRGASPHLNWSTNHLHCLWRLMRP